MANLPEMICEYLEQHESATALELSQALECTPANIRHHLARLRRAGKIELAGQQPAAKSRGRPLHYYGLGPAAQEQNLAGLASALIEELLDGAPADEASRRLAGAARRLAGSPAPQEMHVARRLNTAVRRLKDLRYNPRWEARADGPRLILVHCPYAALLPGYTQALCQFDRCLLEAMLSKPVHQLTRPGLPPCEFSIR